jgi:UDP-3-O-[3-hydroxymyristoyl] N-acetylglucosamine deacetylase/3-hydroxyacyl-[acyl-carrier-protein] dehydratase
MVRLYFVEAEKGSRRAKCKTKVYVVKEVISFTEEETGSEILIMPVTIIVLLLWLILNIRHPECQQKKYFDFKTEISESRTFSFLHELEELLDNGLIN